MPLRPIHLQRPPNRTELARAEQAPPQQADLDLARARDRELYQHDVDQRDQQHLQRHDVASVASMSVALLNPVEYVELLHRQAALRLAIKIA